MLLKAKPRLIARLALLVCADALLASCSAGGPTPKLEVKETFLGTHSFLANWSLTVSSDSQNVAWVEAVAPGTWRVVVRGENERDFEYLGDRSPLLGTADTVAHFTSDTGRLMVSYTSSRGSIDPYRSLLVLSRDGSRVAYFADEGDRVRAFVDGAPGPAFEHIVYTSFEFSADGSQFSYPASDGQGQYLVIDHSPIPVGAHFRARMLFGHDGATWTVVDRADDDRHILDMTGKRRTYEEIGEVVLAVEGSSPIYSFRDRTGWRVVGKGGPGRSYEAVRRITQDENGIHLAYVARRDDREFVVLDSVEGRRHDRVEFLEFAPKKAALVYAAREGGKSLLFVNGNLVATHDGIGAIRAPAVDLDTRYVVFSDDGCRFAYVAEFDDKASALLWTCTPGLLDSLGTRIRNRAPAQFDYIGKVALSSDGKRLAYSATDMGPWSSFTVVGRRMYRLGAEGISFGPDPNRVAFWTATSVNIDGEQGAEYREVLWPTFSPKGDHFAYVARKQTGQVLVLDGVESPEYEEILLGGRLPGGSTGGSVPARHGRLTFLDEDEVGFIARRGERLLRVRARASPHRTIGR